MLYDYAYKTTLNVLLHYSDALNYTLTSWTRLPQNYQYIVKLSVCKGCTYGKGALIYSSQNLTTDINKT